MTAFCNERDPRKRAALYAKELKPRLAEGDDLPLKGATVTSGTLAGTLVTQRTLELLKYKFPVLSSIATDMSDQPAVLNQVMNTRIVGIPSAVAYESGGSGTGWADQDVTFQLCVFRTFPKNRHIIEGYHAGKDPAKRGNIVRIKVKDSSRYTRWDNTGAALVLECRWIQADFYEHVGALPKRRGRW